jgi:alkylhydroperoxidase family enzyme
VSRKVRLPPPTDGSSYSGYRPEIVGAVGELYRAAMLVDGRDPVVLEVVRVRCARVHDCRRCKVGRYIVAHDAGVEEAQLDQIDDYEHSSLDERLKVALRFTDAFVTRPGDISPELRRDLRSHFTPAEIVAIALEIVSFSVHKPMITLGLDGIPAGVDTDVMWFDFDAVGDVVAADAPR